LESAVSICFFRIP
jgi:hypothetical protein